MTADTIVITRKHQAGSLSIEMIVAVGIMAILLGTLAPLGASFKRVNDHHWAKHLMLAAGQAQMDALVTTGKPIDDNTFKRLWPTVQCTILTSEGQDPWQGLEKIELRLSAKIQQKVLKTSLTRYVLSNKEPQK